MSAARFLHRTVRPTLCQRAFLSKRFKSLEAYEEKIRRRTQETGLSLEELKAAAEVKNKEERRASADALRQLLKPPPSSTSAIPKDEPARPTTRKDESPVKPLSDILRLSKIATANKEQVAALWTAYHASRSEGTGRGYLCAAVPRQLYDKMASVGSKYTSFIVPLPRPDPEDPTNADKTNYEFYFMQWNFHHSPPVPSASDDPFDVAALKASSSPNPKISTILFTPLAEYKMRNSFATPYLILTHYTDLAHTHDVVLLRGEITPAVAGTSADGRYMLSQEDAQKLVVALQKFYLWGGSDGQPEGERLLETFHREPEKFNWEEVLKFYNQVLV